MVGAAENGSGSLLYPSGVTSVEEIPDDLQRAIQHAQKILTWYKNLEDKEVPPRYVWPFDDLLVQWFERVKRDRDSRRTGGSPADSEEGTGGWMDNDLAKGLRD